MSVGALDFLTAYLSDSRTRPPRARLPIPARLWPGFSEKCEGAGLSVQSDNRYRARVAIPGGQPVVCTPEVIPVRDRSLAMASALLDVDACLWAEASLPRSLESFQEARLSDTGVRDALRVVFEELGVRPPRALADWENLSMLPALLIASAVGVVAREILLDGLAGSAILPCSGRGEILAVLVADQTSLAAASPREWVSSPVFMWAEIRSLAEQKLLSVSAALAG